MFDTRDDELLRSSSLIKLLKRLCLLETDSFFATKMLLHDLNLIPNYNYKEYVFYEEIGNCYLLHQVVSTLDDVVSKISRQLVANCKEYCINGHLGIDPERLAYSGISILYDPKEFAITRDPIKSRALQFADDYRKIDKILKFAKQTATLHPIQKVMKVWNGFKETHDEFFGLKSNLQDFAITICGIFNEAYHNYSKELLKDRLIAISNFVTEESVNLNFEGIYTFTFEDLCEAGSIAVWSSDARTSSDKSFSSNSSLSPHLEPPRKRFALGTTSGFCRDTILSTPPISGTTLNRTESGRVLSNTLNLQARPQHTRRALFGNDRSLSDSTCSRRRKKPHSNVQKSGHLSRYIKSETGLPSANTLSLNIELPILTPLNNETRNDTDEIVISDESS